jgi:hypothetical protein
MCVDVSVLACEGGPADYFDGAPVRGALRTLLGHRCVRVFRPWVGDLQDRSRYRLVSAGRCEVGQHFGNLARVDRLQPHYWIGELWLNEFATCVPDFPSEVALVVRSIRVVNYAQADDTVVRRASAA